MVRNNNWTDLKLVALNRDMIAGKLQWKVAGEVVPVFPLLKLKEWLKPHISEWLFFDKDVYPTGWDIALDTTKSEWYDNALTLLRARAETALDLVGNFRAFYVDNFGYFISTDAVNKHILNSNLPVDILDIFLPVAERLKNLEPFDHNSIQALLKEVASEYEIKLGILCNAIRVVTTGQPVGASLFEILEVLGKEKVFYRLSRVANDEGYLLWLAERSMQIP